MSEDAVFDKAIELLADAVDKSQGISDAYGAWLEIADEAATRIDYESMVTIIGSLGGSEDTAAWIVGDLLRVKIASTKYGGKEKALEDVARDTGRTAASLRERLDTAEFWTPAVRKTLLELNEEKPLTWSHFNRARRGMKIEDATKILDRAAKENWTVARLESARLSKQEGKEETRDHHHRMIVNAIRALAKLIDNTPPALPSGAKKQAMSMIDTLEDLLHDIPPE